MLIRPTSLKITIFLRMDMKKIGKLGEIGDTANVKSGYARNFLFPRGKAIPATRDNLEEFEKRKTELVAAHNSKVAEAQRRAEKVKGLSRLTS